MSSKDLDSQLVSIITKARQEYSRSWAKLTEEEFSELSKMPSLWTRSYFVSTAGNVCSETIKKYVENQKKRY